MCDTPAIEALFELSSACWRSGEVSRCDRTARETGCVGGGGGGQKLVGRSWQARPSCSQKIGDSPSHEVGVQAQKVMYLDAFDKRLGAETLSDVASK